MCPNLPKLLPESPTLLTPPYCKQQPPMTENDSPAAKNTVANASITAGGNVHIGDNITHVTTGKSNARPRHLTFPIPTNAEGIIGRERELGETYRLLHGGKPAVLVNGVGGMGKTATAVKYIARYGHEYAHLAWLTVPGTLMDAFIGNATLLQSFQDLQLENSVQSYLAMKNPEAAFQLVFKTLDDLGMGAKTLVVLDNTNNLPDLLAHKKYFDSAHCHFLLTSRTRPEAWQVVSIERLPDAEALALFRQHYPSAAAAEDSALLALFTRLDFHTLLLELVAKSAAASGIPFDTLRAIVRDKFIHAPALNKRPVETGAHGHSLEDQAKRAKVEEYIWLIFENVTQLHDGEKALLRAFALLPTATAFDEAFLENFAKHFDLEAHLPDRLDRLVQRGWLDKEQATGQAPTYKIHPLIAEVVVKHLAVDAAYAEPYTKAIAKLIYYNSTNPSSNLFEINNNRPLAERLSDLFFAENTEGVSELLHSLNWLDQNFGFYEKAKKYGERALAIAENLPSENHALISKNQSTLALVYGSLGRYERAAELLETALNSAEKNFGPDHPTVAVSQSNLANVYGSLGRYERAAELLETALNSDLKNFGPDHPNVAVSQSNLAVVHLKTGKKEEAKVLFQAALQNFLKNFGPEHPHTKTVQDWLSETT